MAGRTSPSTGGANRRTVLAGTAAALAAALSGCDPAAPASRQSSDDAAAPAVTGHKPRGKDVIDVVADCGAKGDGRTDDSRAFARAYSYAADRVWDHVGRTVIDVPVAPTSSASRTRCSTPPKESSRPMAYGSAGPASA